MRWGPLRGLQVQGDGFGVGFFPPLNSIFSTRRSSRGSRRQLLLRETSGFAVVADALIPVPWKTLPRPAPQPPRRRGNNKFGGEKQDGEEHGSVRLRDLKQLGGMMLEALARSGIAGGSCRALGDAGGPGRVGADGGGNLPPALGSRGFHQRGAGGGDSAARVLLGTVTASGTAWPWPLSHAPPRWLVLRAWLARDPAGSSVSPRSLWSPMLLSPLVTDARVPCIPLVTNPPVPCIPLVTGASVPLITNAAVPFYPSGHLTNAPVTSVSLVTVASVPFYLRGQRCLCPLHPCGHEAGFVPRGSAGCEGTPGAVGTCHQAPLRAGGQGRDPIPCWSIWEPCSG